MSPYNFIFVQASLFSFMQYISIMEHFRSSSGGSSFSQSSHGGAMQSTIQSIKENLFSTTGILIVLFVIVVAIISVYMYITTMSSSAASNPTGYKANYETDALDSGNKTATLMMFSTDWCPHCKTARPEWNDMQEEYENKTINGYTIVFEDHNCTEESVEVKNLIEKYGIEGYPTIKLIKDNTVIEYDAKPTKETMVRFLNTVL